MLAFRHLVERHQAFVYRVAYRFAGTIGDAEGRKISSHGLHHVRNIAQNEYLVRGDIGVGGVCDGGDFFYEKTLRGLLIARWCELIPRERSLPLEDERLKGQASILKLGTILLIYTTPTLRQISEFSSPLGEADNEKKLRCKSRRVR